MCKLLLVSRTSNRKITFPPSTGINVCTTPASHKITITDTIFHQDDRSEIDIEAVTQGTSLVNNTINYTNHPSVDTNGAPIKDATLSIPLTGENSGLMSAFREHRFDSSVYGVNFFLDGNLVKTDNHSVPQDGGSVQFKLWADGNKWWSGIPSTTDVHLSIRSIIAYYNTSHSQSVLWSRECNLAGGPNEKTVCDGQNHTGRGAEFSPTASSKHTSSIAPVGSANAANKVSMMGLFRWMD